MFKLKNVEFKEQYLHNKPNHNAVRSLRLMVNGFKMISFMLEEDDTSPVTEAERNDPDFWLPRNKGRDVLYIAYDGIIERDMVKIFNLEYEKELHTRKSFLLSELDLAKQEALNVTEKYIQTFIE